MSWPSVRLFCVPLILGLSGCFGTAVPGPAGPAPAAGGADPAATYGQLLVHGNFCGPGYPELRSASGSIQEQLAEMKGIRAIDRVDAACYAHDVCYVEGNPRASCDEAFISTLETIKSGRSRGLRQPSGECALLVDSMLAAFYGKTVGERSDPTEQAAGSAMAAISTVDVARNTSLQRGGLTELVEQASRYLKGTLGVSDKRPVC